MGMKFHEMNEIPPALKERPFIELAHRSGGLTTLGYSVSCIRLGTGR